MVKKETKGRGSFGGVPRAQRRTDMLVQGSPYDMQHRPVEQDVRNIQPHQIAAIFVMILITSVDGESVLDNARRSYIIDNAFLRMIPQAHLVLFHTVANSSGSHLISPHIRTSCSSRVGPPRPSSGEAGEAPLLRGSQSATAGGSPPRSSFSIGSQHGTTIMIDPMSLPEHDYVDLELRGVQSPFNIVLSLTRNPQGHPTTASMSSTEILFNSPALHSLKRAQLVKICKRHGVKASGKNLELVERLQEYAKSLPTDIPVVFDIPSETGLEGEQCSDEEDGASTATDSNANTGDARTRERVAVRPSEPWSIIEEDSREEENGHPLTSQASAKSGPATEEFGGENISPSKFNSVGSSLRAFASSLKRVASGSQRSVRSTQDTHTDQSIDPPAPAPASRTPSPEPEPNTYCPDPTLAASSIRLIPSTSNINLLAVQHTGGNEFLVRTKSEDDNESADEHVNGDEDDGPSRRKSSLYPELPEFAKANAAAAGIAIAPGGFPIFAFSNVSSTPSKDTAALDADPQSELTTTTSAQPMSPLVAVVPAVQSKAATAASILEEMNRRMGVDLSSSGAITMSVFEKKPPISTTTALSALIPKGAQRFEDVHQKEFDKMDSIVDHYAARRAIKAKKPLVKGRQSTGRARSSLSATPAAVKRRSQASMAAARPSALLPKAAATAETMEEDGSLEAGPSSLDVTQASDSSFQLITEGGRKHITIVESSPNDEDDGPAMPGGFGASSSKSKPLMVVESTEAAKKRLSQAKAKKRSSMARASMGKANIIGTAKPKPAPAGLASRFGFLKSSAKLVKSVWGAATGTKKVVPQPTRISNGKAKAPLPSTTIVNGVRKPSAGFKSSLPNTDATKAGPSKLAVPTIRTATPPPPFGSAPSKPVVQRGSSIRGSGLGVGARPIATASRRATPTSLGAAGLQAAAKPPIKVIRPPIPTSFGGPSKGVTSTAITTSLLNATGDATVKRNNTTTAMTSTFTSGFGVTGPKAGGTLPTRTRKPSTLMAPTASSRAKFHATVKPPPKINENQTRAPLISSKPLLEPVSLQSPTPAPKSPLPTQPTSFSTFPGAALEPITNTLVPQPEVESSPSKDFAMDFGIPATKSETGTMNSTSSSGSMGSKSSRRPRISRSKIIAKLEEKRAAEASAAADNANTGDMSVASASHIRRSQGGAAAPRRNRRVAELAVELSAKKAFRRSEIARRKTQVTEWNGISMDTSEA